MQSILILLICAIVVQFATDRIKVLILESYRSNFAPLIALILGVAISFSTRVGLFGAFGIVLNPVFVDYVITGIAYSGGAVAFNELVKLIRDSRQ